MQDMIDLPPRNPCVVQSAVIPSNTSIDGSSGVVGVLWMQVTRYSVSVNTTSVNVLPMSTPMSFIRYPSACLVVLVYSSGRAHSRGKPGNVGGDGQATRASPGLTGPIIAMSWGETSSAPCHQRFCAQSSLDLRPLVIWGNDFPVPEELAQCWRRNPEATTELVRHAVATLLSPHDGHLFPALCHD